MSIIDKTLGARYAGANPEQATDPGSAARDARADGA